MRRWFMKSDLAVGVLSSGATQRAGQTDTRAKETASQMVSELFFGPMLAQMRKFPFGTEIGSGGRGEEVFGEQLDRKLADSVAAAQGGPLIRQLEARLENRSVLEVREKLAAQRKLAEARFGT